MNSSFVTLNEYSVPNVLLVSSVRLNALKDTGDALRSVGSITSTARSVVSMVEDVFSPESKMASLVRKSGERVVVSESTISACNLLVAALEMYREEYLSTRIKPRFHASRKDDESWKVVVVLPLEASQFILKNCENEEAIGLCAARIWDDMGYSCYGSGGYEDYSPTGKWVRYEMTWRYNCLGYLILSQYAVLDV